MGHDALLIPSLELEDASVLDEFYSASNKDDPN